MGYSAQQIKEAERQLAQSIGNDVQKHLITQQQNAYTIAQNYTTEVRSSLIAWGCDAACVNRCTENPSDLTHCNTCTCPHTITVTANPADTEYPPLHEFFN
jgi:hypothetical protein